MLSVALFGFVVSLQSGCIETIPCRIFYHGDYGKRLADYCSGATFSGYSGKREWVGRMMGPVVTIHNVFSKEEIGEWTLIRQMIERGTKEERQNN